MKILCFAIDIQNDFMNQDGKLYVKNAELIKPQLKQLTQLIFDYNLQTIYTTDVHCSEDKEISATPDFKTTFPEHCIIGTQGAACRF